MKHETTAGTARVSHNKSVLLVVIGLALVVLVNALVGVAGFLLISKIRQTEVEEQHLFSEKKSLINRMQTTSRERAISLTLMVNLEDPFARDDEYLRFVDLGGQFADARDRYIALGLTDQEKALLKRQAEGAALARIAHDKLIAYVQDDDIALAQNSLAMESIPMQEKVFASLGDLIKFLEIMEDTNNVQVSQRTQYVYTGFLLAFLVVTTLIGGLTGRYLVQQLSRAQRDLNQEKDRFKRAAHGSNDGIWEWRKESGKFFMSSRWAGILGYSENELPPTIDSWLGRVHTEDQELLRQVIDAHCAGNTPLIDHEHRLRAKSGEWVWCRMRGIAERDSAGNVTLLAGSLTDISAQKQDEADRQTRALLMKRQQATLLQFSTIDCRKTGELRDALMKMTESSAQVMRADRIGIWFYDASIDAIASMDIYDSSANGHSYGELLTAEEYPEFFQTLKLYPLIVTDKLSAFKDDIPEFLRCDDACSLLVSTIRSGAELLGFIFFEVRRNTHAWTGDEIGFATNVGDMVARAVESCRRQKMEDHLAETNLQLEARVASRTQALDAALIEAREASRAKSEFLANMSHEIRTPMNGVLGMLDVLRGTELSAHQLDLAGTAYSSGEMLLHLLNDILDLSKIEAGKLELERTDFDLRDKLESVLSLLAQPAHSKGLELMAVLPPGVPTWINGDPTRIRQILTNLVGNAIKFTDHGEVVLTVELEETRDDELWLRFCVRDTGIGIAAEAQTHIFDLFSQADGSTTRRYGGSGLGLAISRHLCQLMGGEIGVESNLGRGSNFWFRVCLHRAQHPAPEMLDATALHGRRVLIVDDNATNCRVLEYSLAAWGLDTESETDPQRALDRLRAGEVYDVALLDMMMPGMNGQMLAERIRAEIDERAPQLVMLTSVTSSGCREAVKAGILNACLNKPVRQSTLYNTLLSLFGEAAPTASAAPVEPGATRPERLLVVEDHPVNQKVARGILKQLGYAADLANNGREAVELLLQGGYDLVFMDCQMPELDGYDATRELRRAGIRTPIVAMTANAMQGDRERCLDAGMDDYVSKPLKPAVLEAVLERWLLGRMASAAVATVNTPHNEMFDAQTLSTLRTALGDEVGELFDEFFRGVSQELQELEVLLAAEDVDGVQRLAHRLKGSSGNIGLKAVANACQQLEKLAQTRPTTDSIRIAIEAITHATQATQQAVLNGDFDM